MRSKIPIGHFWNEATIIMKLGNGLKSPCEFYLALTSLQGEILLPFVLNIYRVKIGTIVGIIFFFLVPTAANSMHRVWLSWIPDPFLGSRMEVVEFGRRRFLSF